MKVADAFPGAFGEFANNPVVAAGFEAIFKGGKRARTLTAGWLKDESGGLFYCHQGARGGRILVHPNPPPNPGGALITTERLWEFIEGLNPLTADVALAVLAQLCEPSVGDKPKYPMLQPVLITARAIMGYKRLHRRGKERHLLLEKISDEMERLRGLHFDVESFPTFDGARNKWARATWQGDRLFDIVKVDVTQENLSKGKQVEIAWSVRAGQWAYYWLNPEARVYVARVARSLLELDHRENRGPEVMAKKIGLRIVLLSYISRRSKEPLRLRTDHLLEYIGELPVPSERGPNWAARVRENVERALIVLGPGDGIAPGLGVISRVEWPCGFGPGYSDRSRGWVENWLSSLVVIITPQPPPKSAEAASSVANAHHDQGALLGTSREVSLGRHVRQLRMNPESPCTQSELARYLGISRRYLSEIERGNRQPSPPLAAKISKWNQSRSLP